MLSSVIVAVNLFVFYECPHVNFFWLEVEHIFNMSYRKKIYLRKKDVIFYYEKSDIENERNFILLGKYFIHKCKWTKKTKQESKNLK